MGNFRATPAVLRTLLLVVVPCTIGSSGGIASLPSDATHAHSRAPWEGSGLDFGEGIARVAPRYGMSERAALFGGACRLRAGLTGGGSQTSSPHESGLPRSLREGRLHDSEQCMTGKGWGGLGLHVVVGGWKEVGRLRGGAKSKRVKPRSWKDQVHSHSRL